MSAAEARLRAYASGDHVVHFHANKADVAEVLAELARLRAAEDHPEGSAVPWADGYAAELRMDGAKSGMISTDNLARLCAEIRGLRRVRDSLSAMVSRRKVIFSSIDVDSEAVARANARGAAQAVSLAEGLRIRLDHKLAGHVLEHVEYRTEGIPEAFRTRITASVILIAPEGPSELSLSPKELDA